MTSNKGFSRFSVPLPEGVNVLNVVRDGGLQTGNDELSSAGNALTGPSGGSLDWGTLYLFSVSLDAAPVGTSALNVATAGAGLVRVETLVAEAPLVDLIFKDGFGRRRPERRGCAVPENPPSRRDSSFRSAGVLHRARQEQSSAVHPIGMAGAVERRQRMAALAAGHLEIAVGFIAGGDAKLGRRSAAPTRGMWHRPAVVRPACQPAGDEARRRDSGWAMRAVLRSPVRAAMPPSCIEPLGNAVRAGQQQGVPSA